MNKNNYLIFLILIIFFSCTNDNIDVFSDGNEIFFEKFYMDELYPGYHSCDSTTNSFFFYPEGTKQIEIPVVVCLSGIPLKTDQDFTLKVIKEKDVDKDLGEVYTTAESSEYTIDEKYTFHANNYGDEAYEIIDTIAIMVNTSERLKDIPEGVRLVVELVPTDNLKLGQYERRRAIIRFSNIPSKPKWWTKNVTKNLLGEYSVKKYKLFLAHADPESTMSLEMIENRPDQVIKLVLKFKEWLIRQNPVVTEENGDLMTIKI
jgi:hypothetical protein